MFVVGGMCFMIELYRSSNQGSSSFDRHNEICRDCAEKEIREGHYVEYDLYLSERTDAITRDDTCQICEGSFFVDGRKTTFGNIKSCWNTKHELVKPLKR